MNKTIKLTGLENILNEGSLKEANPSNFKFISIDKIIENEFNAGRQTKENVELIKQSIIDAGLINALIVYPENDNYKLISGHGRLQALKQLKLYNFQGNEHYSDEIPVFIDKTKRSELDYKLNILRANAQKDESIKEKIENVKKAQEIFLEKKKNNLLKENEVNKREFISNVTGYSLSSVRDYLSKINNEKQKEKVEINPTEKILKHIVAIDKLFCENYIEKDDTKILKEKLKDIINLID